MTKIVMFVAALTSVQEVNATDWAGGWRCSLRGFLSLWLCFLEQEMAHTCARLAEVHAAHSTCHVICNHSSQYCCHPQHAGYQYDVSGLFGAAPVNHRSYGKV